MNFKLPNFNNPFTEKQSGLNGKTADQSSLEQGSRIRRKLIQSIQSYINERRTMKEKLADDAVAWFGSFWFITINVISFILWIVLNIDLIPGIKPFDPYPFILLTMAVSLEAIFLAIFVLISQNRESRISDLREEIDIQVNMIAEQEITKLIHLVSYLMKHLNVPYEKDPELKRMMRPLDTEEIRLELEKQLNLPHKK